MKKNSLPPLLCVGLTQMRMGVAGVVGLSAVNLNGWSLSGRLPAAVFIPPLPWGDTVYIFKGSGKVQLVGVAHGISYVSHGQFRELQKFRRFGHAVGDKEFLGGFSHVLMEDFSEIASVQAAGGGDILHGDIVLKVLLNEGKRFFNVKIPQASCLFRPGRGRGADQTVQKQVEVPDEMEGRLILVIYHIHHFIFHGLCDIFVPRPLYRLLRLQSG